MNAPSPAPPAPTQPVIGIHSVSKSFGDRAVLKDISFSVAAGSTFVLLGRSGTGKSVTLKLICGLIKPDSGAVIVNGHDIAGLNSRELAAERLHMGFLFQSAALFDSISVGENVAFPLRRHAQQILEKLGLGKEYDSMPGELSGGMRKRAGLDPITAREIDELLIEIGANSHTKDSES